MATYKFKTRPYQHQVRAVRKLLSNGYGGALLMDPRTGKTKTAIDYLSILAQKGAIDRAVIICPAKVMDVWVKEFHTHCPLMHNVFVWDKDARKFPPPPANPIYRLNVLVVNYDAFSTPGPKLASGRKSKRSGRFKNRSLLWRWMDGKKTACVLDESHKIKSPSGKAANMIVDMQDRFRYRVIMTGTPITKAKRSFDIYMQWGFLNPERFEDLPTVSDFKNHYGKWTNRNGFPQYLRPQNHAELTRRIREDSFIISRDECFDMPRKRTRKIMLPLMESAAIYDMLAEEMVAEIESAQEEHNKVVEASIALTLTLRLSQITGGYAKTTDGELLQIGTEKLRVLQGILEEARDKDEKLVIGARFKSDIDGILKSCELLGIPGFPIRGKMKRHQVTKNIEDFTHLDECGVVVMQPAAGGLGIDLSTASQMIWYSLTPSWVDFTQANDRIALSKLPTLYTYLLAKSTVDTVLYDSLKTDGEVVKAITANPRKVLRK